MVTSVDPQTASTVPNSGSSTHTATAAPRRRDPEARRREILAAAAELAAEHGVAALTHRAIAARAGVPLGSTTQHFASIDELREAALQRLAEEIDESLATIEPYVAEIAHDPSRVIDDVVTFLHDRRTVRSDIALMTSGTTDPRLRALALRWNDRLIDMLTEPVGAEAALAISVYLDGATIHAGLHDDPLSREHLTRVLLALARLPQVPDLPDRPELPERTGVRDRPDLTEVSGQRRTTDRTP
ncbi:TetR family transcriptional regulator [Leucobacter luti]|uniref:TetR/AcrR family transcriptional regulator n=1 Tax=Leucobacter luti TaxID=340320 RepID=UPI0010431635|nr:TetR family transcriptional regulator [Leucobacter luti]MCW2286928.1 DNA-binding transcriptional regulator YbjK [Leucobacter luti]TCK41157.1 TetR family transcriptional regulator [Leucobacter luti]